jgi:hypothetical protein
MAQTFAQIDKSDRIMSMAYTKNDSARKLVTLTLKIINHHNICPNGPVVTIAGSQVSSLYTVCILKIKIKNSIRTSQ